MSLDSATVSRAMREHLEQLKKLRGTTATGAAHERLHAVKRWQTERLVRTYADLRANPRYREATDFFVEDLYGPKDFSARDAALLRIVPVMVRVLPAKAVEAAAISVEVEALSEALDHRLAAALPALPVTEEAYAAAYRESASPAERTRQIRLLVDAGARLDELVTWPFVFRTLKLMRAPARLAGLSDLQDFLERGFHAFSAMGGAGEFLRTIEERETRILTRLFSDAAEPFST